MSDVERAMVVDPEVLVAVASGDVSLPVENTNPQEVLWDLSFEAYKAIPALNSSRLAWGRLSMQHLRAALLGGMDKDSSDMAFGRALHCRLLEPDVYKEKYKISPGCEAVLVSGKNRGMRCGKSARILVDGKFACGVHGKDGEEDPHVITADEAKRVEMATAGVFAHPVVKLLRQSGGYEASGFWNQDGFACKMRLDKLCVKVPAIIDVKKVQVGRGSTGTLERDILNYNYDFKAAWYVRGYQALFGVTPAFVWIFVEDGVPHAVNVKQADDETLAIGEAKVVDVIEKLKRARDSGEWPGYSDKIEFGGLPEFEKAKWRGILGGL